MLAVMNRYCLILSLVLGFGLAAQLLAEEKEHDSKAAEAKSPEAKESAGKAEEHAKPKESHGNTKVDEHAAGKAHHDDPLDIGHGNATRELTSPAQFKADSSIFSLVIFLVLMAILTKFAWKPIAHGLEAREKGIEDKIEQARLAAEKATEQLREYEARLASATQEAQQIVGEARKTAEAAKEKILSEAQALAQREREKAVADITAAKNQALREIAEKSVDTAIGLARNIIRREVRPGDHEQLIQDALKQFPNN